MEAYNNAYNIWLRFFYLCEELQLSYLGEGYAFLRVGGKHLLNGLDSIDTDIARNHIETFNDLFVKLLGRSFLKRKRAAYHSVENDSQRPDVSNQAIVSLPSNHFRRSIARTSTSCTKQPPTHHIIRQPKIYQFDIVVTIQ